jgi:hypothetical protein
VALAILIAPWVASYYYIDKKRSLSYLKLLLAKPKDWDVAKAVEELQKLLKKRD